MDLIIEIFMLAWRSLLAVLVLFIISRLTGARQISQLTFYDYIVGISIGSIAAMAVETDTEFWYLIVSMGIFGGFSYLLSLITNKSIALRRVLTGKPSILMHNGKIIRDSLKKNNYDVNDLLLECRLKGYFNIDDVDSAILETNGQVSVLPKPQNRPLTPKDMAIPVEPEKLVYNLILDGKVLWENVKSYGKDEAWLKAQLKLQNVTESEVLLATGDLNDKFSVYLKSEQLSHNNYFM